MNNEIKARKEIGKVLKRHGLEIVHSLAFPTYRKLPDEVQLALKVLGKHGMVIRFILNPIKK